MSSKIVHLLNTLFNHIITPGTDYTSEQELEFLEWRKLVHPRIIRMPRVDWGLIEHPLVREALEAEVYNFERGNIDRKRITRSSHNQRGIRT